MVKGEMKGLLINLERSQKGSIKLYRRFEGIEEKTVRVGC